MLLVCPLSSNGFDKKDALRLTFRHLPFWKHRSISKNSQMGTPKLPCDLGLSHLCCIVRVIAGMRLAIFCNKQNIANNHAICLSNYSCCILYYLWVAAQVQLDSVCLMFTGWLVTHNNCVLKCFALIDTIVVALYLVLIITIIVIQCNVM